MGSIICVREARKERSGGGEKLWKSVKNVKIYVIFFLF